MDLSKLSIRQTRPKPKPPNKHIEQAAKTVKANKKLIN